MSDLAEYADLLQDPTCTVTHYFQPIGNLTGASADAFQLVAVTVDGRPRPARRAQRAGSQVYTVNLGVASQSERQAVTIAYTYRVLVQKGGHLLYLDIARPTKGFRAQLAYGGSGIRYVSVQDYIASSERTRLSQTLPSEPTPTAEVSFDGWVLPKAGVSFIWVLESEMAPSEPDANPKPLDATRPLHSPRDKDA